MATIAQLEAEPWWGREIVTSPMVGLGIELRAAYGAGSGSVGIKGNTAHLSGGHRSQEWIKRSAYCTNRTYATQTNVAGDQLLYCAALDFTPGVWGSADNRAKMRVLTKRVIDAMQAGRCDELLEVFGTLDGTTVTGWRNDENRWVTSDSSHLDHLHLRFDRRYCNDNAVMSKMAAILLEDDMTPAEGYVQHVINYRVAGLISGADPINVPEYTGSDGVKRPALSTPNYIAQALKALGVSVDIDPAELAAIQAAAAEGAKSGALASADALAAAVVAKLPAGGATAEQVEAAVREVFADAGQA